MTSLTDDKILQIVEKHKRFDVSLKWGATNLRKQCYNLVKQGKLQNVGRVGKLCVFISPKDDYKIIRPSGRLLIIEGER